jgi:hypothetical protein
MLVVAGLVLLALGILCGALMLLIPLGMVEGAVGLALWIFFPLFSVAGYLMAAAASRRDGALPLLSRATGAVLIVLALAAAVALVLQAAALFHPAGDTLSLWYVLAIGIVLGAMGLASRTAAPAS